MQRNGAYLIMPVFRIYVEKKPEFAVESKSVLSDVKTALRLDNLNNIRILNRYDAEKLSKENFDNAINTVFSEPAVDFVHLELPKLGKTSIYLLLNIFLANLTKELTVVNNAYNY